MHHPSRPEQRYVRSEDERRYTLRHLGAGVYDLGRWPFVPDRRATR